ncbi:MAG: glycosyltransferase family 39 protein, partial [Deltaproteobacteria bacterium]|nr:glycosyltransferase family 39 protein [Deltaproteobacteria bacterium]
MERRYLYLSWFLILLFSSFRLLYILSCSIDLSPDEAQYWNWSRHLGISYYTKGPLIAYLLRMTTAVFGDNVLGVRSLALITSTISYLAVLYFTKKVFDTKTAFLTVLIGEFLPISNAGAIISHVDAPLLLLWTFSFIYAYKMENKNTVSWIFLGVLIGLGFLAKYSMYLFVFSLIIYLLFTKKGRIIISNRFIFMLLAIIIVSMPVFIWSFEHSFANFFHLFHLTKIGEGRWLSFSSLGDYIGGQAGALSPVFFIVYIISMFFCLKKKLYYLFFFSFPIFLIFLIVSIHTSVYANWPGCAYVAGTIATAFYLKNKKKLLILCMVVAFLFDFFAYGNNLLYIFLKNPKQNPANRLKGWSELACEV